MPELTPSSRRPSQSVQQSDDHRHQAGRRALLHGLVIGTLACSGQRVFAQGLNPTPAQTEGPFYPDRLPLDQDNDLVRISGRAAVAAGEVTDLTGRVLDAHGKPLGGVVIEIWQVDHNGHYIHSRDAGAGNDAGFQGFGRFETGQDGAYRFRTIKPVPYPGRTPHIHVKLRKGDRVLLTTQLYVQGHPLNERDGVLRSMRDPQQRAALMVPFLASRERQGELTARFDIVLA